MAINIVQAATIFISLSYLCKFKNEIVVAIFLFIIIFFFYISSFSTIF